MTESCLSDLKKGCGKELTIRFENQSDMVSSYCGLMNLLCDDCKIKVNNFIDKLVGDKK